MLLISDWLNPALSAKELPEIRCRFRSWTRSRTTSVLISFRRRSFDTFSVVNQNSLDSVYHYNDTPNQGLQSRSGTAEHRSLTGLIKKTEISWFVERFGIMERIAVWRELSADAEGEKKIKQRILEKVAKAMEALREGDSACAELNPDVIVVTAEQSFLFEPQNWRVTEWLSRYLGLTNLGIGDRIRVHPARRNAMVHELKAAGFNVVY